MEIRWKTLAGALVMLLALVAAATWRTAPAHAMAAQTTRAAADVLMQEDGDDDDNDNDDSDDNDDNDENSGPGDDDGSGDENGGHGNGGDDGDDDGDDNEIELYGRIEVMPSAGLTGTWTISGTTFTADSDTEFETEHGGFALGVCVEVEADEGTPSVAEKIETESDYKCTGASDDDGDGDSEFESEFYGEIVSLPADPGLVGTWVVGSMTFSVTASTELDAEAGPFEIGVFVKVHLREDGGQKVAREVETRFRGEDDGDDDNDDGAFDGHDGHAFGPIVSMPGSGMVGPWNIAGVVYTATAQTEFDDEETFAPGVNVKVEFFLDASGQRIATEIEITDDTGGVTTPDSFKFVGYVEAKPQGFIGVWTISGQPFKATDATRFDESDGLLTSTSYVEVTYQIVGDERIALKIDTEVPPGGGPNDAAGTIDDLGDDNPTSATARAINGVWTIAGKPYTIAPSTNLNDAQAALEVGATVVVNSYTDAGQEVATRVRALNIVSRVMAPIVSH